MLIPDRSYRDYVFDSPQIGFSEIYLLEAIPPQEMKPEDKGIPLVLKKHDVDSTSWIRDKSLQEFVLETFPDAMAIHSSDAKEDSEFGFKINAICSVIAAQCRRGIGNNLYVGPGIKFGPKTQSNLDLQSNGQGRDYWIQYVDWLPEGKILNLYWNRSAPIDIPFLVTGNGDILVNRFCERYGAITTVPDSQLIRYN